MRMIIIKIIYGEIITKLGHVLNKPTFYHKQLRTFIKQEIRY